MSVQPRLLPISYDLFNSDKNLDKATAVAIFEIKVAYYVWCEVMKIKLTLRLICIAAILASPFIMGNSAHADTISLWCSSSPA